MHALRTAIDRAVTLVGVAFIGAIGFADDWTVGPIVVALGALLPALPTFVIAAGAYGLVQYGTCEWMQRRWGDWIGKRGRRIEAQLERWRRGRILRHPARWITRDSIFLFVLASVIFAPVIVVAIARISSDRPISRRRMLLSCAIYGVWFAALYTAIGYGIGIEVRSF